MQSGFFYKNLYFIRKKSMRAALIKSECRLLQKIVYVRYTLNRF